MNDAELFALATLVRAECEIALVANQWRAWKGYTPAYGEEWAPDHVSDLESELKLRGVISR